MSEFQHYPLIPISLIMNFTMLGALAADCHITIGDLYFGSYDVFDYWPTDSVVTMTLHCREPLFSNIQLGAGPSINTGSISQRAMVGTVDRLYYNLFLDPGHNQVLGDGMSGGTVMNLSHIATNTGQRLQIYGRIPAGQNVHGGEYSDSVVLLIMP